MSNTLLTPTVIANELLMRFKNNLAFASGASHEYDARFNKIGDIKVPLLMFQGDRDTIVPEKMARRLFARANPPKTFQPIPGAGHNDTLERGGEPYWSAWRRFIRESVRAGEKD